ncbi:MAG: hypothetical protein ACRDU9_07205 [Acidimicrobiia bacterium]
MDTETIATEIEDIRKRLGEIQDERTAIPEDAFEARSALLDEEHELAARLAELRDLAAEKGAGFAEKKAASQTDLTHSPNLPDGPQGQT